MNRTNLTLGSFTAVVRTDDKRAISVNNGKYYSSTNAQQLTWQDLNGKNRGHLGVEAAGAKAQRQQ